MREERKTKGRRRISQDEKGFWGFLLFRHWRPERRQPVPG